MHYAHCRDIQGSQIRVKQAGYFYTSRIKRKLMSDWLYLVKFSQCVHNLASLVSRVNENQLTNFLGIHIYCLYTVYIIELLVKLTKRKMRRLNISTAFLSDRVESPVIMRLWWIFFIDLN